MIRTLQNRIEGRLKESGRWITLASPQEPRNQTYTWTNGQTGETTTWAVWMLAEMAKSNCRIESRLVERNIMERLLKDGGIEMDHVARLSRGTPAVWNAPGIIVQYPDGGEIVADGAHRYAVRFALGLKTMRFRIVPSRMAAIAELEMTDDDHRDIARWHQASKAHSFGSN